MSTFHQRLAAVQKESGSLLCVGLDIDPERIDPAILRRTHGLLSFNKRIIDATVDLVSAYKLNFAFYESLGAKGWKILERTLEFIPPRLLSIADAKRGDIGNTSSQYAKTILHDMGFDAVTVAPYMGKDSVAPFLADESKGVFLLALTSNEGAFDFQYKKVGRRRLFEEVVAVSQEWDEHQNLCYVVGATKGKDIGAVRALVPRTPLLVPGIGAQGGSVEDVVRHGCTVDGTGILINASRSILYASRGNDFAKVARSQALKLNNEINFFRQRYF